MRRERQQQKENEQILLHTMGFKFRAAMNIDDDDDDGRCIRETDVYFLFELCFVYIINKVIECIIRVKQ